MADYLVPRTAPQSVAQRVQSRALMTAAPMVELKALAKVGSKAQSRAHSMADYSVPKTAPQSVAQRVQSKVL